ncbi:DUF6531 domain-containing protein [Kitasatospora mediocidica]|uniref:DUF6531 domain-containing protein n=1 Tax=Kitasatospora mediocidica TaxID=58352 RepID=UPI000690E384|nr:DUF6531 domain-containing protein [Kitasatospora mediocidica]
MSEIAKIIGDGAKRIGKSLGQDTGEAVKKLYHQTGANLDRVTKNHVDNDSKHAGELQKLHTKDAGEKDWHPGKGGPGGDSGKDAQGKGGSGGEGGENGKGGKDGTGDGHPHPDGKRPTTDGAGPAKGQVNHPHESGRTDDKICGGGEPVDMATGRMFMNAVDVSLPGALPLLFSRSFESGYQAGRWLGRRWTCTFDERLERDTDGVIYLGPDRVAQLYPHPVPGDGPVQASAGDRWELELDESGTYLLTDVAGGLVREFTPVPQSSTALLTRLRDRSGRWLEFDYDASGAPASITHHAGYRVLVTVDRGRITALRLADADGEGHHALLVRYGYTDGRLTAVYDVSGAALRFTNDEHDRITSWTDRNGGRYSYRYDEQGRVVDQGSAAGYLRFQFRYTEPDPTTGLRITYETDAHGNTTEYHVNHLAQVVATVDPVGRTTHTEYDEYHRVLAHTDALRRTTRYEYDGLGALTAVVRPDGERSELTYQGLTTLPTEVRVPGGALWRQEYDAAGRRTAVINPAGAVTRYRYDENGNLAASTDALGTTTEMRCDPAGLPMQVTGPDGTQSSCERDPFGRPTAITDPLGGVTRFTWTAGGRLAARQDPDGTAESWTWDGEGNIRSHTDKLGQTSSFEYNEFDLVTVATSPDGSRYTFSWDATLRLVAVTNPLGQQWQYAYDAAGRLRSETDFHGRTVAYGWDAGPRPTSRTDAFGQTVRHRYDVLDQLVATEYADHTTSYAYDVTGNLIAATGPDAELRASYDVLGNLLAETVDGRTVSYAWDVLGRCTGRTLPSGHSSSYSYDTVGHRVRLESTGGRLDFAFDTAGRELHRALGGDLTLANTWDAQSRLTTQTLQSTEEILQHRSYQYRADGHPTRIEELLGQSREFELTATGRVTAVRSADQDERYSYDGGGHLTAADWPATAATRAARGERAREGSELTRAGDVRYEYDRAGRVTLRQIKRLSRKPDTWRFEWDAQDQLTHATTPDGTRWRYRYDPLGRRIAKERLAADGTVAERVDFSWDGPRLAEQTTRTEALPGPYTLSWDHVGFRPLAQTETIASADRDQVDRRFYAIVTDLVGTPTELVDTADGTIAWRGNTTLWGHTSWPSDSTAYTPLRFPGQYFDPETRLHYNHHRYYDPATARYASPDPLGIAPAANPDTYVPNPLVDSDPLGLAPCRSSGDEDNPWMKEFQADHPDNLAANQPWVHQVRTQYQNTRLGIKNPWHSNFAVLQYLDKDTGKIEHEAAWNAGERNHHAEEAIINKLQNKQVNYKPLNLFSDRQPCKDCWPLMNTAFRSRGREGQLNVYFVTAFPEEQVGKVMHDLPQWWR